MSIPTRLRHLIALLALGWLAMPNVKAAEQRVECPKEIPREDVRVVRAPAGWTPFVPFEYTPGMPLTSAGVMYGPPSVMAISKPNGGARNSEKWTDIRPLKDGVWMACYYGDNGRQDMILSQRLDDATTECTVTYSKNAEKRVRLDIRCRS